MTVLGAVSWSNNHTFVMVESTNETWKVINPAAKVPFTAPASGKVAVVLSLNIHGTDVNGGYVGALNGTEPVLESVTDITSGLDSAAGRMTHQAIVTGLTPNAAYTFHVGICGTPDGNLLIHVNGNPNPLANEPGGPVTMLITALP